MLFSLQMLWSCTCIEYGSVNKQPLHNSQMHNGWESMFNGEPIIYYLLAANILD